MKEPTITLTLASDIQKREEISKRLLKFGRVKIIEKYSNAPKEIEEAANFVINVAERAEIRPELGYTEIIEGKTIKRFEFKGSNLNEILNDIKQKVMGAAYKLNEKLQELEKTESELTNLKNEYSKLLPFKGIKTDLTFISSLKRFAVKFYTSKEPVQFECCLSAVVQRDKNEYLIVVYAESEKAKEIEQAAYTKGLVELQPPAGSPEDMLNSLSKKISELQNRFKALSDDVLNLKIALEDEINAALESLQVLKEVSEIGMPAGRFIISKVEILRSDLRRFYEAFKDITIIGGLSDADEVELKNPIYMKNFDPLTETQGVPGRYEIDPTPIISLVFPFFFGFMFPDAGQGLVLFALGLLIYLRGWKNKRKWGAMLASFGASATIMGLLAGEFFGFEVSAIPFAGSFLEKLAVLKSFSSLTTGAILTMLSVAILIGIFHLTSGYFLDFKQTLKKDRKEAFLEKLPVLIAYIGAVFIGLSIIGGNYSFNLFAGRAALINVPNRILSSVTVPVTAASIFIFLFYTVRRENPLDASIQFMFIVIEFLANTISYSRLAILFLVHIVLMKTLNATVAMGAVSWPLIVFGNLGIMALEGLIVYIQSLRLHVYEWFTKFYLGNGTRFRSVTDTLTHASIYLT
ncbi:MAG: V-type ATPase 116kDa subunit family protein [Nitrososphaeria archaeon]|nr:V-type ATPase 116kDa subunit family protein [Conexivisphaerales archaeon]